MYYEEKLENGILYCRSDPHGEWEEMSYADVVAKYRASNHTSNVAYQLANDRKQAIAALTAERNAWREDADRTIYRVLLLKAALAKEGEYSISKSNGKAMNLAESLIVGDILENIDKAINHHRQLHERYPTEKSDTDKGE